MNTSNERRVLAEGKYLRLVAQSGWEWVERVNASGAAVIAAVTEDERLVLVEQYRIPMQCRVLDLPAGLVGDDPGAAGEAMIDAARRELFEETGYEGTDWHFAVSGPASPGLATEVYSLFVVRGVQEDRPRRRRRPREHRGPRRAAGRTGRLARRQAAKRGDGRSEDLPGAVISLGRTDYPARHLTSFRGST